MPCRTAKNPCHVNVFSISCPLLPAFVRYSTAAGLLTLSQSVVKNETWRGIIFYNLKSDFWLQTNITFLSFIKQYPGLQSCPIILHGSTSRTISRAAKLSQHFAWRHKSFSSCLVVLDGPPRFGLASIGFLTPPLLVP